MFRSRAGCTLSKPVLKEEEIGEYDSELKVKRALYPAIFRTVPRPSILQAYSKAARAGFYPRPPGIFFLIHKLILDR